MPETGRTGKRVCANLRPELIIAIFRERRDKLILQLRRNTQGADERWRKSFNGYPLTTGCGDRILYLEATQRWLEVRELLASVSPTLFVVDPGAASATA
jgi:hypothetical protein